MKNNYVFRKMLEGEWLRLGWFGVLTVHALFKQELHR